MNLELFVSLAPKGWCPQGEENSSRLFHSQMH